ncbi:MAG: SpoIIE family protein phosphatase [Thermodesulfobacteriota bacterium]
MLALDRGRGMGNVTAALRDGFSTSGTSGTGLGAVSRLADAFDVHSAPGVGTIVLARVGRGDSREPDARCGVVCVAKPGETVTGDGWAVLPGRERTVVMVVDGLGHGPGAAEAAEASLRIFAQAATSSPGDVLERVHGGLRGTRGAAAAVALIDRARGIVRFAGIGNIAGCLMCNGTTRSMVSQHGTAGHDLRRIHEFDYPLPRGGFLVMNSDGLLSSWDVKRYPGLLRHHPAVIAGALYRDFARGRDDATVVVLEEPK